MALRRTLRRTAKGDKARQQAATIDNLRIMIADLQVTVVNLNEVWSWLDTLNPTGGSKLEKAVNYACNHHETLMNYMLDGRCEVSNSTERRAKAFIWGERTFYSMTQWMMPEQVRLFLALLKLQKPIS